MPTINRARRIELAVIVVLLLVPLLVVARKGDPLFLGVWYYLAVPLGVLGGAALVRPRQGLLAGAALTLSLSFLAYQWVQLTAIRLDGLLGLGHLHSVPGAFIAVIGMAVISRLRNWNDPRALFAAGFLASAAGFILAQIIVCSTRIYCGVLTLRPLVEFFGTCARYAGACP